MNHDKENAAANSEDSIVKIPNSILEIDIDEIDQKLLRQREWTSRELIGSSEITSRCAEDPPARLNIISLEAWLAVARMAGIDAIPAREIAIFPVDIYFGAMDHDEEARRRMHEVERTIVESLEDDEVLRFDQVAPSEVKEERSEGKSLGNGTITGIDGQKILTIYDERFYMTLQDHGGEDVVAFARPRFEMVPIEGVFRGECGTWPAEFRVFVEGGEIVGISNYYPQVDMDPEIFSGAAKDALKKSARIVETMRALKLGVATLVFARDFLVRKKMKTSGQPSGESKALRWISLPFHPKRRFSSKGGLPVWRQRIPAASSRKIGRSRKTFCMVWCSRPAVPS